MAGASSLTERAMTTDQDALRRRRRTARVAGAALAVAAIVLIGFLAGGGGGGRQDVAQKKSSAELLPEGCERVSLQASPRQYDSAPDMMLEDGIDYRAVIHTSCGDIEMDLVEERARVTVNNFVFLARAGFYDGLTWHRVERNFLIQTGDPNGQNGTPPDGPGYTVPGELPDRPREYVFGVVAMADAFTAGSQFFIVVHTDRKSVV